MGNDPLPVWLVDNGKYWKAAWPDPKSPTGQSSKSLGAKAKFSRRQATVLCRQLAADLTNESQKSGECPNLFAWLDRYIAFRSDVKDTTKATYREAFAYLRVYFDNNPTIDAITRADAADWLAEMNTGHLTDDLNKLIPEHDKRRRWRKPSLSTIRRHVRTARQVFKQACDDDRIKFNPFDRLNGTPPKMMKSWREVTHAEAKTIIDACPNAGWRMLFALCRFAGLRRNESLSLEWGAVDWDRNRMVVNVDVEQDTTKQAFRITPIEPARCPTGLARMMREAFESATPGTVLVCEGVNSNNLRRTALAILRRSGVGVYAKPFHTLRKNRITEVAMEYPQGILEEWFGHDEEVSRRHYQRVPEELYAMPNVQIGRGEAANPHPPRAPSTTETS